ncbi:HAD family hydrolase [Nocardiopsis mangrovi]|uniref:HAD family hydrolase n=1 Tax=Nocardiopsis mangrovi TaxID=1179818 RepID=A0ABV9DR25_9ACTN
MGRSSSLPTILFDYGEVISLPQPAESRAALERLAGVDPADFWAAYWAGRRAYDQGDTAAVYWDGIARSTGADWDTVRRQQLWAADVASWLHLRDRSVRLLERLAARGARLALLSNASADMAHALRRSPALAGFDSLFFSSDLALCKPDPEIYTRVLGELGAEPEHTVFIDDREENILAAKALGIDAHHYTGPEGVEAFLAERIGPL